MAHFAELDDNNVVVRVIVISNDDIHDARFATNESEAKGVELCRSLTGTDTTWVQTSYRTVEGSHPEGKPFRYTYAGIGFIYRPDEDHFMRPCPYPSWSYMSDPIGWAAPIPKPDDGEVYDWDEENQTWNPA